MRHVLTFGTFDELHEGHIYFLRNARKLGDFLSVVVARDLTVIATKKNRPIQSEDDRLAVVRDLSDVDNSVLGNPWPMDDPYRMLSELDFDVIALGYDQGPSVEKVRVELEVRNKPDVFVVRLSAYKPNYFKSSLRRSQRQ